MGTGDIAATMPAPVAPRIRLFNVKFSPNLGDGLLSECLEKALIDCGADADSWSIDLAARTSYGAGPESRSAKLRVLNALPGFLRPLAVRLPLAIEQKRHWGPHYRKSLEGADCVVIGGGNLLADLDLNFPTKIALAVTAAAQRRLPVFIYACGASRGWSRRGLALLRSAADTGAIKKVFVRDEKSRATWDELIGEEADLRAGVVRDPGLLASERYRRAAARSGGAKPVVGLNVISQLALHYHSANAPAPEALDRWYVGLASELVARGYELAVFTNGSPEDRLYARRLAPQLQRLGCDAVSFPELRTPADLAGLISGLDALVAFRMHAIIAAYSFGVPFLALSWDPKLDSFVGSVGLTDWLCSVVETPANQAAERVVQAIGLGIADDQRQRVIADARHDVARLFEEVRRAIA